MKEGRTLIQLAQEIERQTNSKKDYLADTRKLEVTEDAQLKLTLPEEQSSTLEMSKTFDSQMAQKIKIPKAYYDRMKKEAPSLFAENVNHWLQDAPEKRMVRTLDGQARAFLSERYRTLDNYDLLQAALPVIEQHECEIVSCQVTDERMYIKALFPKVEAEVEKDDIVQAGLCISNSEIGAGSLKVEPLIFRLVCTNGMIANTSMKKYHVGRANGTSYDDIQEILTDKTRQLSDAAFWMQVQDVIRSVFNRDIFDANVNRLRESLGHKITGNPVAAVAEVKRQFGFTEDQGSSILRHLIEGKDLSQWGIANAVTRTANDLGDYETATTFERVGGKIIELAPKNWKAIAEAA